MSDVTKNSFTDLLATLSSPVNIKFAVMLTRDVVVANAHIMRPSSNRPSLFFWSMTSPMCNQQSNEPEISLNRNYLKIADLYTCRCSNIGTSGLAYVS